MISFNYFDRQKAIEKYFEENKIFEMCDVCGKIFDIQHINRIKLYGTHTKILYTIRYCPYCNPYFRANIL